MTEDLTYGSTASAKKRIEELEAMCLRVYDVLDSEQIHQPQKDADCHICILMYDLKALMRIKGNDDGQTVNP